MSPASKNSFISSFLICNFLLSFVLARNCSTMLNRSGTNGHPCLVPDPGEKAFSLLPLSIMLVVGFYKCSFLE